MTLARSIIVFFVALVFSALLWAYVRLSAAYESDVDLPVKLIPPKGYALASGLPQTLHTRLRGAGWQIMTMNFTKNSDFTFDLSERVVGGSGGSLLLKGDEIANAAVLPSELRVLKVEPDSLRLDFDRLVAKRLPVEARIDVRPSRGYVVGKTTITPSYVLVNGAPSVLDSLRWLSTQSVEVLGAKEPVDRVVQLSDSLANFISVVNAPKISIHVEVEAVAERTLAGVAVTVEALPPDYELVLIPNMMSVTVRGGVNELAKLQTSSIRARVVYDPRMVDTAHTLVPLVETPNGITYLASDPQSLRFIVRKKNLQLSKAAGMDHQSSMGGTHAAP
ncbi:MAG: hypothetical protein Q8922_07170 [Bacteroidota bacterium]|nr:hypothetical protein [Bacteroidota bacterium]MDP4233994.1 hypothetical protein [Bacteroidota bacterium]MDP4242861.1 hypothetical protein [Bacteroidota bacterium]MDP4287701.1 hypothetical protein [Bacteroidota bacterium]